MRYVRIALLAAGGALLAALIAQNDPAAIATSIGRLSWRLGVIVCFPVSLVVLFEAFGAAIRIAAFLIPASLGAVESGFVVTFVGLGLDATTGLSFALVRRLREAVCLGLLAFARMRPTTPLR